MKGEGRALSTDCLLRQGILVYFPDSCYVEILSGFRTQLFGLSNIKGRPGVQRYIHTVYFFAFRFVFGFQAFQGNRKYQPSALDERCVRKEYAARSCWRQAMESVCLDGIASGRSRYIQD